MTAVFMTIAVGHLLALMSPGPDFAVVSRQTLAHGRAAGVTSAAGIAVGIALHLSYALFGLGFLLLQWPWLSDVLRYAGAAFLIWMGVNALRSQPMPQAAGSSEHGRAAGRADFAAGLLTNLLNPKATMYFVAVCSALTTTAASLATKLALGAWILASTFGWFALVACTLGHPSVRTRLLQKAHWIDRVMGALLLGLGLWMLLR